MQILQNIWDWWYHFDPNNMWRTFAIPLTMWVVTSLIYYIIASWYGRIWLWTADFKCSDLDAPCWVVGPTLASLWGVACFGIWFLFPICFVVGVLTLLSKGINKWGTNYRTLAAANEKQKLSALAELIKDDPEVKKAYDKLMKDNYL